MVEFVNYSQDDTQNNILFSEFHNKHQLRQAHIAQGKKILDLV